MWWSPRRAACLIWWNALQLAVNLLVLDEADRAGSGFAEELQRTWLLPARRQNLFFRPPSCRA